MNNAASNQYGRGHLGFILGDKVVYKTTLPLPSPCIKTEYTIIGFDGVDFDTVLTLQYGYKTTTTKATKVELSNGGIEETRIAGKRVAQIALMDPNTGDVMPRFAWEREYRELTADVWGGPNFEDAGLVEVVMGENGKWNPIK